MPACLASRSILSSISSRDLPDSALCNRRTRQRIMQPAHLIDLFQEPGIDMREFGDSFDRHACIQRRNDIKDALWVGHDEFAPNLYKSRFGGLIIEQAISPILARAKPLLQRLGERAPDSHHFAHRFQLLGIFPCSNAVS